VFENYSFGLVGYPVEHSLSPSIHMAALQELGLQGEYRLYPVEETAGLLELLDRMRLGSLLGLNVTIPYKSDILPFLDTLTPTARAIGAANTVIIQESQLVGDNTDAGGFLADLERLSWSEISDPNRSAIVLGAGGSARAVVYALALTGWQVTIAARRREQATNLIESIQDSLGDDLPTGGQYQLTAVHLDNASLASLDPIPGLVINTTPLGMYPQEDASPWPEDLDLPPQAALYDLVYNPDETTLMSAAREDSLRVANGLGMLVEQAALSFEIWTGLVAPRQTMHQAVMEYSKGA
jgi:shikimate dehydrogenase